MPRTMLQRNQHNAPSKFAEQQPKTRLTQYVGFFIIGYVLVTALFTMIQTKVMLNSQLLTVISILIGAYIAVHKFIKHQQRALHKREINRLTFTSISMIWLLSAVYLLGLWVFLFDAIDREVLLEMAVQQPLPLLGALIMILLLTLISARVGIWVFNRLLDPKRKVPLR